MRLEIKTGLLIALLPLSFGLAAKEPPLPIRSGTYTFQHKYAEHPSMPSFPLTVIIKGHHISLVNKTESQVFPKGEIASGTLMWHAKSNQWIIGDDNSERFAEDVGGCSAGPEVVDLKKKIYWTC
jgi:hypothetical protein